MSRITWNEREPAPALILRFDRDRLPLWDMEVNRLVEALEERLDGVFVTPAAGPGGPTLRDALAAARLAGCAWAVVAAPSTLASGQVTPPTGALPSVAVRSQWNPTAIAAAYEHALGRVDEMAAGG